MKFGSHVSSSLTLSTGSPQGCVLSPLLYALYTYDCVSTHPTNKIIKFADDTTVVGLISGGDETAYREEVCHLIDWCTVNHLQLNTTKTKEVIIDFRKNRGDHAPLYINGDCVERVTAFKFLGVHISETLPGPSTSQHWQRRPSSAFTFWEYSGKVGWNKGCWCPSISLLSRVCSLTPSRRGMLGVRLETRSHYRGS